MPQEKVAQGGGSPIFPSFPFSSIVGLGSSSLNAAAHAGTASPHCTLSSHGSASLP